MRPVVTVAEMAAADAAAPVPVGVLVERAGRAVAGAALFQAVAATISARAALQRPVPAAARHRPHTGVSALRVGTALLRTDREARLVVLYACMRSLVRGLWFTEPREVFWPQSGTDALKVAQALLNYFVYMVIIIVVAVPEGLPMSVTVSLALAMQKCLEDLSREAGIVPEWKTLLRDLDRLQHVRIRHRYNDWLVRTDVTKPIADLFRHAHIALPPRAKQMAPPALVLPTKSARKRRGRPRRGATSP